MFPLAQRKFVHYYWSTAAGHIARGLGIACDWEAVYTELWCPFKGTLYAFQSYDGGNWLRVTRPNGDRIEFAHLSTRLKKSGPCNPGELIAYTGNTGATTSGPHLHCQIFVNGKRVDPDRYNWEDGLDVKAIFRNVWKREGTKSEINVFLKRLELGTIKPTLTDITEKMSYWYGIVYPNGKYSPAGDARWQIEKIKYL